ncbi:alpha/beta fold hydrolase [Nocardia sp. NPDC050697]|uniref:alpha/beta fold hydrolase n=1 Tax=Nocardia sp. NPDC050697 TaxID=3155158 RepID=UPI0033ECA457
MTAPPHALAAAVSRRRGGFFLAGDRDPERDRRTGAAWVQWEAPAEPDPALPPVILVHGGGGQSTDWMWASAGQPGWAELFVAAGHPTYLFDRPGHGRSPWDPDTMGARDPAPDAAALRSLFGLDRAGGAPELTPIEAPATGLPHDTPRAQTVEAARLAALLARTGPAVLVAHSAGAPGVWLAADRHPELVRAVVAVEPLGPPHGGPRHAAALAHGVAAFVLGAAPGTGLALVPTLVVSAEASGHAPRDAATAAFLRARGVPVEHLELGAHGLRGDGHGLIFDTNSTAAFELVHRWCRTVTA